MEDKLKYSPCRWPVYGSLSTHCNYVLPTHQRHRFPHWRDHLWQIHTKLFLSIIKLLVHSISQVKEKRGFSLDVNYCLLTTIFMMVQQLGYMPLTLKW